MFLRKIPFQISALALLLGASKCTYANNVDVQIKVRDLMLQKCQSIVADQNWKPHQRPVALRPEKSKQVETYEVLSTGTILSGSEKMGTLANGAYVYLIDSQGKLIYTERTPANNDDPARHLATHRSLAQKLSDVFGTTPKIIAAGEFFITNGRVSEVNNKSGTYRGGPVHLNYAIETLGQYGLKIESTTLTRDFSKNQVDIRHLDEKNYSILLSQYRNTTEYALLVELYAKLAKAYPDSKPGHMNAEPLQQKLADLLTAQFAKVREIRKSAPDSAELKSAKDEVQMIMAEDYVVKTIETEVIS